MSNYVMTVIAEGDELIIQNTANNRQAGIRWDVLSNTKPGLKYRNECIAELRRQVDGDPLSDVYISDEAEALIEKATEAARMLY